MFGQQGTVGGNKQVCSFYLKGACKYGAQCWNLHPQNQGGSNLTSAFGGVGGGGGAGLFGQKPNTQQDTKDFAEFVKQVSGEMNQWERSGQWLLSSFAPLKSKPPISGFTDTSPEELRIQAYEALKNNTSQAYQTHWNEQQQRSKQLREALRMSTPEATQALREVFHAKVTGEQAQQPTASSSSLFGKPAGQSLFGGSSSQPSTKPGLLGASPQSSIFGGSSSVFGGNQSSPGLFGGGGNKTMFGGQAALGSQGTFNTQQASSTFGGGTSVFGSATQNQATSSSIFGGSSSQNQSSTMFGGTPSGQSNSSNIFAGSQNQNPQGSLFGRNSQTQPSVFGGMGANNQGSVFGSSQPSLFGNASKVATPSTTQGTIFGGQQQGLLGQAPQQQGLLGQAPQQQGLLGQAPQQQGLLGQAPQQQGLLGQAPQQQTGLFGKPATSTPSVFGGNTVISSPTTTPSQSSSIFGNKVAQNTGSIFGGNTASSPSVGSTGSSGGNLFGNASNPSGTPGLFGKPAENKPGLLPTPPASQMLPGMTRTPAEGQNTDQRGNKLEWYTPLEKLQPVDRARFEADIFTSLPLCAPPIEFCF